MGELKADEDEDDIDDLEGLFTGVFTDDRFLFDFLTTVGVSDICRLVGF